MASSIGKQILGWTVREHQIVAKDSSHIYASDRSDRFYLGHIYEMVSDNHNVKSFPYSPWKGSEYVDRYIL